MEKGGFVVICPLPAIVIGVFSLMFISYPYLSFSAIVEIDFAKCIKHFIELKKALCYGTLFLAIITRSSRGMERNIVSIQCERSPIKHRCEVRESRLDGMAIEYVK